MANVYVWRLGAKEVKAAVTTAIVDDATATLNDIAPFGLAVFCNQEIYDSKGLAKIFGQTAIDVLRDALIDNSGKFYVPTFNSLYISTKLLTPKPITHLEPIVDTGITTLLTIIDPDYEVGFFISSTAYKTTGLPYTAYERIRDYICETNGVIP